MTAQSIDFYWDYISHNAYLAWTQLPPLLQEFELTVRPVPVLFAGLLKAHGQLGPAEIRPKALWMIKDVLRKAQRLGVPLNPPASHPFNPLLALRVTTALQGDVRQAAVIDALFRAVWVDAQDVTDAAVVARILAAAGVDAGPVLQSAATAPVKQELADATAQAVADGVFGVPSLRVQGELFFGYDDFDNLRRFLRGNDVVGDAVMAPWLAVRPSSERRR